MTESRVDDELEAARIQLFVPRESGTSICVRERIVILYPWVQISRGNISLHDCEIDLTR